MKFNIAKNKKMHYTSLNEILKNNKKEKIAFLQPIFEKIKQDLYDKYSIENIYLYGDILEKDNYKDNTSIFIEMKKNDFEELLDKHYFEQFKTDFYISMNNTGYYYKNKKWEENQIPPDFKLLI